MNQAELVERVAKKARISKAEAKRMLDIVFNEIEGGLKEAKKNGSAAIPRLGTFRVTKRAARKGRNPQTGEEIRIRASKSLRLKPAASLKKAAGC
jgi:DNA-binding protein HU-beta